MCYYNNTVMNIHTALHSGDYESLFSCFEQDQTTIDTLFCFYIEAYGHSPLYHAAENGFLNCLELLLSQISKVNLINKYIDNLGSTKLSPLHIAVWNKHYECVRLLINCGASLNCTDNSDYLPVHIATFNHDLKMLKLLVSFGADPIKTNHLGKAPLHIASFNNDISILEFLLSFNADVNAKTNTHFTPLHFTQSSEKGNHLECTKLLLEHGADVNAKNADGETPLHLAAKTSNDKAIEYLLSHGAEINVQTESYGETPLHLAIPTIHQSNDEYDYDHTWDAVKALLEYHPNLDITNWDGETPLEFALSDSRFDFARLLIDYGANAKVLFDDYINSCGRSKAISFFVSEYEAEFVYFPGKYRNDLYDLLHDYLTEDERMLFEAVKRANRKP